MSGVAFIPLTVALLPANLMGGAITARFGHRLPMAGGMFIAACGYGLLAATLNYTTRHFSPMVPRPADGCLRHRHGGARNDRCRHGRRASKTDRNGFCRIDHLPSARRRAGSRSVRRLHRRRPCKNGRRHGGRARRIVGIGIWLPVAACCDGAHDGRRHTPPAFYRLSLRQRSAARAPAAHRKSFARRPSPVAPAPTAARRWPLPWLTSTSAWRLEMPASPLAQALEAGLLDQPRGR